MNFKKLDILKNYFSNRYIKTLFYILLIPVVLALIYSFWHIILGISIIYLGYIKIRDEKTKWLFIAVITIALIIAGIFFDNNLEVNKKEASDLYQKESKEDSQINSNNPENKSEEFLVTRIIDGDTIEIEGGKRVRYIGIDTPETVDPNRPVGCYGKEASNKNSELVLNKKVKLIKDVSETDRYGRLLRYVYVGDLFVNDTLIKEGYAKASTYAPDVKFSEHFTGLEREARENKKGLWGSDCELSSTPEPTQLPTEQKESTYSESISTSNSGVVKKSSTGICHAPGTTYYFKTKNFTPYNSIEDCLNSGGRLPLR